MRRPRGQSVRRKGHHRQMTGARMIRDVGVDAVERADVRRRQHLAGRAVRNHAAVASAAPAPVQSAAARFRSCVDTTIVDAALAVQPREQRRDLELIAEIERRRRLVEQQHVATPAPARAAITTRCFSPPLSVANCRASRPPCRWPPAPRAQSRGRRRLRARTRRDADSVPSAPFRATLKSNAECVSCGTTAMRRASSRRADRADCHAVERHLCRRSASAFPASSRSSVVLPEPFGPEQSDDRRRAAPPATRRRSRRDACAP